MKMTITAQGLDTRDIDVFVYNLHLEVNSLRVGTFSDFRPRYTADI